MDVDPGFCDGQKLLLDQACLQVHNDGTNIVRAFNVSAECYDCSPQPLMTLAGGSSKTVIVSTAFDTVMKFAVGNHTQQNTYLFHEHGHYLLSVNNSGYASLSITTAPDFVFAPLWYALGTFVLGMVLWGVICWMLTLERVKRFLPNSPLLPQRVVIRDAGEEDLGGPSSSHRPSAEGASLLLTPSSDSLKESSNRTISLDVFRGITVTLMIFVNYGGGKYSMFEHSAWNGLTFADIVFPWFAWIMGFSLYLSMESQLRNTVSRKRLFVKVLLRSLVLIALGIVLNSFNSNNIHHLRIPGVLQRLGLAFFIVGTMEAFLMIPQNSVGRVNRFLCCVMWKQWIIMIALVVLHTSLILFVKLDGCPRGYLGPGGLHMGGKAANCTGGITGYIDRVVFGEKHIYQHPTSEEIYHSTVPFDPEGLLGTITTAFTMFLGVCAGRILTVYSSTIGRSHRWISSSCMGGICLLALMDFSKEEGLIPINKNLWSLSFVLASSSLANVMFLILYILTEDGGFWNGAPFTQVGRNALFLYVGHIIMKNALPWNWSPIDFTTHSQLLWMNLWSTFLWVIIAVIMDLCHIYIKI